MAIDIFMIPDARIISLIVMCPTCGEAHELRARHVYFTALDQGLDDFEYYSISIRFTCPTKNVYTKIEDI